jgi:hypothetical protein
MACFSATVPVSKKLSHFLWNTYAERILSEPTTVNWFLNMMQTFELSEELNEIIRNMDSLKELQKFCCDNKNLFAQQPFVNGLLDLIFQRSNHNNKKRIRGET